VTVKNAVLWDVGFVRTDVSEERVARIFRVKKIHEPRKALAVGHGDLDMLFFAFFLNFTMRSYTIRNTCCEATESMPTWSLVL
jgi:hypothetical protein